MAGDKKVQERNAPAKRKARSSGAATTPQDVLREKRLYTRRAFKGDERASTLYGKYFLRDAAATVPGYDLRSDLGVAEAIGEGVPTSAVEEAIDSGVIEADVVYEMVVPRRTLSYRKARDQHLSPEQSDRLARVLRVYARAEEALGDRDRATRWLQKENRALNGKVPLALLSSDAGARAVEKVLGRIEHGIFS